MGIRLSSGVRGRVGIKQVKTSEILIKRADLECSVKTGTSSMFGPTGGSRMFGQNRHKYNVIQIE